MSGEQMSHLRSPRPDRLAAIRRGNRRKVGEDIKTVMKSVSGDDQCPAACRSGSSRPSSTVGATMIWLHADWRRARPIFDNMRLAAKTSGTGGVQRVWAVGITSILDRRQFFRQRYTNGWADRDAVWCWDPRITTETSGKGKLQSVDRSVRPRSSIDGIFSVDNMHRARPTDANPQPRRSSNLY